MIGYQVKSLREQSGFSAAEVANIATNIGYHLQRTSLANLEAGRRKSISVAELSVLATILGTSPLALMFPLAPEERASRYEFVPGQHGRSLEAWKWFTGEAPVQVFSGIDNSKAETNWRIFDRTRRLERLIGEWVENSSDAESQTVGGVDISETKQAHMRRIEVAITSEMIQFEQLGYQIPHMPNALRELIDVPMEYGDGAPSA